MTGKFLACNYLLEAEELLSEKKVGFDFFKFPSIGLNDTFEDLSGFYLSIDHIKKLKPILYHGKYPNSVFICQKQFKTLFDINAFRHVCDKTLTPGVLIPPGWG